MKHWLMIYSEDSTAQMRKGEMIELLPSMSKEEIGLLVKNAIQKWELEQRNELKFKFT